MSKQFGAYVYWLAVVAAERGHVLVEAEAGYKPCKRPGAYRVWLGPSGPCCPGCNRVGLGKDDQIVVRAPAKPQPKGMPR